MRARREKSPLLIIGLGFLALACFAVSSPKMAAASVPRVLNHQGRLFDSSGTLLGGTGTEYCFRFSIYDDASPGGPDNKLWPSGTPSTMTVVVRNGVFSAGIGDVSAGGDTLDYNFQDNDTVYLNIEVATKVGATCAPGDGAESFETLSPRRRIVSSGYAVNAATAGGYLPAENASGTQIPVLTSGNLTLGGTNPQVSATGTNALVLQGNGATGEVRFFGSGNFISSTGTASFGGNLVVGGVSDLQATSFTTASSTNISASGYGLFPTLVSTNASTTNLTASGYLQGGSLNISGQSTLASVSSTNLSASGNILGASLNISGGGVFQGLSFESATGTVSLTVPLGSFSTTTVTSTIVIGGGTLLPNSPLQIGGQINSYLQVNVQNRSSGTLASSDYVVTADNGNDSRYYANFGINASGYANASFTITQANDAYLYSQDSALAIGTASSSASSVIKLFTGGTLAGNERLRVTNEGLVGIGTSTPSATLGLQGTFSATSLNATGTHFSFNANVATGTGPIFVLNTTSLLDGVAFEIMSASSTPLLSVGRSSNGELDWSRVAIGGSATSTRDQLYVYGRYNSSWQMVMDDFVGGASSITADSRGIITFDEDAECIWASQVTAGASTIRARAGGAAATIGDGCSSGSGGIIGIRANENPVLEARLFVSSNTDHFLKIGFHDGALGADTITDSASGIYFRKKAASSTWEAVTRSAGSETTYDTGIAVSTTNLQLLRIEVESSTAQRTVNFFIDGTLATTTTTNVPTTTMGWSATNGISTATAVRDLIIDWIRVWHDDPPGAKSTTGTPTSTFASFDPLEGSDVAEYYRIGEQTISPGSIVRIKDPNHATGSLAMVEPAATPYDPFTIGVVATYAPKITLGDPGDEPATEVALLGRAPVMITTKNGSVPIRSGDPITTSEKPGVGMRAERSGRIIGFAMESYEGSADGTILMFIDPGWWSSESSANGPASSTSNVGEAAEGALGTINGLLANIKEAFRVAGTFIERTAAAFVDLFVKEIVVVPGGSLTLPEGPDQISGRGLLPGGSQEVFVQATMVAAGSKIFVSPLGPIASPLTISERIPGQGFRIRTESPPNQDTDFDWIIFQSYATDTQAPPSQPAASSVPETVPAPQPETPTTTTETSEPVETVPENSEAPAQEAPPTEIPIQ